MIQHVAFAGIHLSLRSGWLDVTAELPSGSPPTLAKATGVGALQFSIARYSSGQRPGFTLARLEGLLAEFGESRSLGVPAAQERDGDKGRFVAASFQNADELVRVWYLTNGTDLALVTYVSGAVGIGMIQELDEAAEIVKSIDF